MRKQEKNLSGKIRTTVKSKREMEIRNFKLQQQVSSELGNVLKELCIWLKIIVIRIKGTDEKCQF